MKKSVSQKIARVFEILNFVLLIPATLFVISLLPFGVLFILHGGILLLLSFVPSLLFYGFGTLLLYGYYKHSRGKISESNALRLWIGTILLNGTPLLILAWNFAIKGFDFGGSNTIRLLLYNIFGVYQIIVLLAVVALINDLRRDFD